MKKGAIFDMDGLLIDSESIFQQHWQQVAQEMNVELDPAFAFRICGTSGKQMTDIIEEFYHVEDGTEIMREVFRRVDETLLEYVPVKKGAIELMQYFHQHHVPIVVASSNHYDTIVHCMEKIGALPYITKMISGVDIGVSKPKPDIFLKSAQAIQLDPNQCYVFEDSFNGVRAGHAAGCYTVMIPDRIAPDDQLIGIYDVVYDSLLDVLKAIEEHQIP